MKAEELMIGDWVNLWGTPIKINIDDLGVVERDETYDKGIHCKPITLTEEILKKNGFKKNNFNQYVLGKSDLGEEIYFEIGFIQLRYPNSYYSILSCGYVHEFQHILRIFGIKKDIVL